MLIISEYNPHLDPDSIEQRDGTTSNQFSPEEISRESGGRHQLGIVFESRDDKSIPSVISYRGQVKSIKDALILFEAARLELIPTVNRRLTTVEKAKYIQPNTVFIWNETQCGVKRWTDGKLWSPSKVHHGSFLIYKHLAKKDDRNDGLIKQSMSILTKQNQKLHLICYYKQGENDICYPSNDPKLMNLDLPSTIYPDNILPPKKDQGSSNSDHLRKQSILAPSNMLRSTHSVKTEKNSKIPTKVSIPPTNTIPVVPPNVSSSTHHSTHPNISISDYASIPHPLMHKIPFQGIIPYSPNTAESSQSQMSTGYQLPPPPPPQPSHYRLDNEHNDSQTLSVLDKGFS